MPSQYRYTKDTVLYFFLQKWGHPKLQDPKKVLFYKEKTRCYLENVLNS